MASSLRPFLVALLIGVVLLAAGCVGPATPQPGTNHSAPNASANASNGTSLRNPAGLGEFCGGIAGIPCKSGLDCKLDGTYPDAGGKCVSASGSSGSAPSNSSQIANPASEFCVQKGGKSIIINEPDGQVGFCRFANGTQVEEWNYYRSGGNLSAPIACTMEYSPVCGSDNRTYGNACSAHAAGVNIVYRGECTSGTSATPSVNASAPASPGASVGSSTLANPASINCINRGGKLEIKTAASGDQTGYCTLPSGKVCEEWALMRGECSG